MKKVVVIGATGNIGVYTAKILKEHDLDVIAVGKRKSDNGFFADIGIDYLPLDMSDRKSFDVLPRTSIDAVIHLAGIYPARMEGYMPELYFENIIKGSFNILEYCRVVNADRVIFGHSRADSNYLMGTDKPIPSDIQKKFPLTGDHSVYTICKNTVVDLIDHYRAQYGLRGFVLRMPTIYSYNPNPFYYVNGIKKWIAYRWIIDQAMHGKPIEVWGDPRKRKEIIYVKDFVQIVEKCVSAECVGGIYNVGSGVGVSLLEQIEGIIEVFSPKNMKSRMIFRPDKPNARQFIHDISKTVKDLGYKQEYDYISLLSDFREEMEKNPFRAILGDKGDFI